MKWLRYLYFLIRHYVTAKTRHGTHSPFVYRLLEDVVYHRHEHFLKNGAEQACKEMGRKPKRTDELIARLARYLDPPNMVLLQAPHTGRSVYWQTVLPDIPLVIAENSSSLFPICRVGFLLADGAFTIPPSADSCFSEVLKRMHPGSVIISRGIYRDNGATASWEHIKQLQEVTVTIDLFHVGLAFLKKDQRPQHFRIRF